MALVAISAACVAWGFPRASGSESVVGGDPFSPWYTVTCAAVMGLVYGLFLAEQKDAVTYAVGAIVFLLSGAGFAYTAWQNDLLLAVFYGAVVAFPAEAAFVIGAVVAGVIVQFVGVFTETARRCPTFSELKGFPTVCSIMNALSRPRH